MVADSVGDNDSFIGHTQRVDITLEVFKSNTAPYFATVLRTAYAKVGEETLYVLPVPIDQEKD